MPRVLFDRVAASRPGLDLRSGASERVASIEAERARVLDEVDAFIGQWAAHDGTAGCSLTTARALR